MLYIYKAVQGLLQLAGWLTSHVTLSCNDEFCSSSLPSMKLMCLFTRLWGEPINLKEPHDAFEFFNCLVDAVDKGLKAHKEKPLSAKIFGGTFADQKICKDCPHRYVICVSMCIGPYVQCTSLCCYIVSSCICMYVHIYVFRYALLIFLWCWSDILEWNPSLHSMLMLDIMTTCISLWMPLLRETC